MYFLDNNSGVNAMPAIAPVNSASVRWFTEGSGSLPPSWPGMDWFNIIQAELIGVLTAAGMPPDKARVDQLAAAIKSIIGSDALLKKNYLSEIKEAGAEAQSTARGNLGLGNAATKNVGIAGGNVMQVGAFGLGGGSSHKADAYNNVGEIYRVNNTSTNAPTTGVAGVVSLPCDGGPSTAYVAVSNAGAAWVGSSSTPASGVKWNRVYTTAYKPNSADVGLGNVGNFMAVQQGGGANQSTNKVYIGWGNDGILRCTVDSTDLGQIFTTKSPPSAAEIGAFPITGGNLRGSMNAVGSVGTQGGAFLIRNSAGVQVASVSANSNGSISVYSDVTGRSFGIGSDGGFFTSNGVGISESGQRVYSPNNPPPNTMQLSVNGDGWWYRDLRTGMIFQGGFISGSTSESGAIDRIPLNIAVPNRLLHVSTIIRNFAQGYQTTWNPQTRNLAGERNGFDWIHGAQEREVYWMAIGY